MVLAGMFNIIMGNQLSDWPEDEDLKIHTSCLVDI